MNRTLEPGAKLGHYTIEDLLAEGGSAGTNAYLASSHDSLFTLKVTSAVERVRRARLWTEFDTLSRPQPRR